MSPLVAPLHRLVRCSGPVAYGRKAKVRSSARNDAIDPGRHFVASFGATQHGKRPIAAAITDLDRLFFIFRTIVGRGNSSDGRDTRSNSKLDWTSRSTDWRPPYAPMVHPLHRTERLEFHVGGAFSGVGRGHLEQAHCLVLRALPPRN